MSSLREGAVSRRLTEGASGRKISRYALSTDLHPATRKLPHPAYAGSPLPEGAGTLFGVQFNY